MGIGSATGEDRAFRAVETAISSPLLEASIDGAHGALIFFQGGPDVNLREITSAASLVQEAAHEEANIIFGTVIDESLGDEIRVTVIAAGFDDAGARPKQPEVTRAPRVIEETTERPDLEAPLAAPVAHRAPSAPAPRRSPESSAYSPVTAPAHRARVEPPTRTGPLYTVEEVVEETPQVPVVTGEFEAPRIFDDNGDSDLDIPDFLR